MELGRAHLVYLVALAFGMVVAKTDDCERFRYEAKASSATSNGYDFARTASGMSKRGIG